MGRRPELKSDEFSKSIPMVIEIISIFIGDCAEIVISKWDHLLGFRVFREPYVARRRHGACAMRMRACTVHRRQSPCAATLPVLPSISFLFIHKLPQRPSLIARRARPVVVQTCTSLVCMQHAAGVWERRRRDRGRHTQKTHRSRWPATYYSKTHHMIYINIIFYSSTLSFYMWAICGLVHLV